MANQNILGEWGGWSVRLVLRGEPIERTPHSGPDPLVVFTNMETRVRRRFPLTVLLGVVWAGADPRLGIILDDKRGHGLHGDALVAALHCIIRTLGDLAAQGREAF